MSNQSKSVCQYLEKGIRNLMKNQVFVGSLALLILSISLPANAQSRTPVTDQFGATGTTPNANLWREEYRKFYRIRLKPDGTFMTDTTRITDEFGVIPIFYEAA
ncbi:MAG TPA: hypothetical protein DD001_19065 [Microcoleaceae bacterium UBA10368]|jgi:hypothetical protein|nr:hypothetical protein [Microcoleaceae cyanobacterium UBA10368]